MIFLSANKVNHWSDNLLTHQPYNLQEVCSPVTNYYFPVFDWLTVSKYN